MDETPYGALERRSMLKMKFRVTPDLQGIGQPVTLSNVRPQHSRCRKVLLKPEIWLKAMVWITTLGIAFCLNLRNLA